MPLEYTPANEIPLPPKDAKVVTTACDYCVVGCGYKAYTWPVSAQNGGPKADQNALNANFPGGAFQPWVSPNQHNIVKVNGEDHHAVVVPDFQATAVNRLGNHSIRGGTLALKCYNALSPTRERLLYPEIRVNGEFQRVDWETATDIIAEIGQYVIKNHGEAAWAMKSYSYEFFENTYAISKLSLGSVRTPAQAVHDAPARGADTAGLDDSGLINFNASYDDWQEADVIFVSGTDPFETKTVLFTEFMMKGPKLIMVLPRRSTGVAYAEANGGLFLQITPGTDTILHLAISRYILEQGWEDKAFLDEWIANKWDIDAGMGRGTRNTPWQWRTTWGQFGTDLQGYKDWILGYEFAEMDKAVEITGIPAEKIIKAAEMISGGGGPRPKASFGLEKGNYWSNNYLNTASFAAMGLLNGAGNRPGQVVARLGGHQRGWMGAAGYPRDKSPEKLPGRRKVELDLDRWVEAGEVRFVWVIGTTWTAAMAASQELAQRFRDMTRGSEHQITSLDKAAIIDTLKKRVDNGGMLLVNSDIYPVQPMGTEFADIRLPAAAWGEHAGTRCNGERRLRLYSKFYDAPGETQPDWWAIAQVGKKMGYEGFEWETDNDVFEEAARFSRGNILEYNVLVWKAKQEGKTGHEKLAELGTTGIQTPIRLEKGEMVGTKRLHDSTLVLDSPEGPSIHSKWLTHFSTQTGKAQLIKSPWDLFSDFFEAIKPQEGEFWVTNGRINEIWQSAFDDIRKPYIENRWPDTFVEMHPEDAARLGIESGDNIRMTNDRVLIQHSGFNRIKGSELKFSWLLENGHIHTGHGDCEAVVIVTTAVKPGLLFTNFLEPRSPANSLVHRVPDPITNRYRFKLSTAKVERLGESPYKNDFRYMSFKPRDVA
ncbi:MAG: arsenate reductase (azurin) large subunit [Caldilineaceae bacterium]|nr:arsenate reductase (azurin) large subunit [Caldilineaceae bacterium]